MDIDILVVQSRAVHSSGNFRPTSLLLLPREGQLHRQLKILSRIVICVYNQPLSYCETKESFQLEIPEFTVPAYLLDVGSGDGQVNMLRKSCQAKLHRFSHS
jgi:hypothetical protein